MRISDWSSDVCSSDLAFAMVIGMLIGSVGIGGVLLFPWLTGVMNLGVREAISIAMLSFVATGIAALIQFKRSTGVALGSNQRRLILATMPGAFAGALTLAIVPERATLTILALRSEEHTSELQSLMRISYAVFCLKKKKTIQKS